MNDVTESMADQLNVMQSSLCGTLEDFKKELRELEDEIKIAVNTPNTSSGNTFKNADDFLINFDPASSAKKLTIRAVDFPNPNFRDRNFSYFPICNRD